MSSATLTCSLLADDICVSTEVKTPEEAVVVPIDSAMSYARLKGFYTNKGSEKRRRPVNEDQPVYSSRIIYADDSRAKFPFSEWSNLHQQRLVDIQKEHRLVHEKHVAWSTEGIRMSFVLHYKDVSIEDVVEHALITQDVMKEYYKGNSNCNFTFWLTGRSQCNLMFLAYQIVYPQIVVDSHRGKQLTLSCRDRIRRKCGLIDVVQDCFDDHKAALTPVYSPELIECAVCTTDKHNTCNFCSSSRKLSSTSVYTPVAMIGPGGENLDIQELLSNHLIEVLVGTSLVPKSDLGLYTPGYLLPSYEPEVIPAKEATGDYYTFKKDHQTITRKLTSYQVEPNQSVMKQCQVEIRKYHPAYMHAVVSRVDRKIGTVIANLSSGGRSFCRVCTNEGVVHKSNRVYFLFDAKKLTLTQMCYDSVCSATLKKKGVRDRLTQPWCFKPATLITLFPS